MEGDARMTEILKESEDRYQTGEDEIAETFDSADEAIKALATTDIPPATKKAYEALKRNNYCLLYTSPSPRD